MTTNTDVNFGIILVINGKDVAIEPEKALGDAKKNGVDFKLPHRVEIGTVAELGTFLRTLTDDAVTLPSGDSFPSPLNEAYKKLIELHLAVEQLDLRVPPSQDSNGVEILSTDRKPTTFTLGLSATWTSGREVQLIQDKLAIKGLYVKLEKKDAETQPTRDAKPQSNIGK